MPRYVPEKGDFVILTFDPQTGREQRGRRPALVVSNTLFNRHTGLAMVCPIGCDGRPHHARSASASSRPTRSSNATTSVSATSRSIGWASGPTPA